MEHIPIPDERRGMKRAFAYFLRGAVITLPVVLTIWIAWRAITWIDSWLGLPVPGVGLLVVIGGMMLIGLLATNVFTIAAIDLFDGIMARLPLMRFLYNAAKDLMQAFAGERRKFNKAVRLRLDPDRDLWVLGFMTVEDLNKVGLPDHVGVYVPQSYNFAGNLVLAPGDQVEQVSMDSADVMTFIVSGGVAEGAGTPQL